MKKNYFVSGILFFCLLAGDYTNSFSQNYIYIGNNRYPSTETWEFVVDMDSHFKPKLWVTVAKRSNGGYLMLKGSTSGCFGNCSFSGNIVVFLSNGDLITCFDRGIKDNVNDNFISVYNLTNNEIALLKQYRITQVRFSILNWKTITNYTATNKMTSPIIYQQYPMSHSTETAVKLLFNN